MSILLDGPERRKPFISHSCASQVLRSNPKSFTATSGTRQGFFFPCLA